MTRTWLKAQVAVLAAIALSTATVPISAHHSWTASYLEDQTVSVEGEIVELAYQNPHAWVMCRRATTAGGCRPSAPNGRARAASANRGSRETLRPGEQVILTGSPDRDPAAYRMHLKRIERPADGWSGSAATAAR